MPMPVMAMAKKRWLPMLTAPIASAPTRPTSIVSTRPIAIHPSSAAATGQASANIGPISMRSARTTEATEARSGSSMAVRPMRIGLRYRDQSQLRSISTPSWSDGQQIGSGAAPQLRAKGLGASVKRRVAVPSPSASVGESRRARQGKPFRGGTTKT